MAEPQPPSPLGHPPQSPEWEAGWHPAGQANSFPIAERVGRRQLADLNHMVVKKKITRSWWQDGEAKAGHGITLPVVPIPPPVAPNKYLQGTPGLVALAGVGA